MADQPETAWADPDPVVAEKLESASKAAPVGEEADQRSGSTAIQTKPGQESPPKPLPAPPKPLPALPLPPPEQAPWWPGPAVAAGRFPLAVAAAAGLLAAVLVPLGRPGIGWPLAALAVLGAAVAVLSRSAPSHRREAMVWGLVAVALLATGVLRAAEWVFWLCGLAAVVAATLAVTRGRTARGLALGLLMLPAAMLRGAGWGYGGLAGLRGRVRPTVRLLPTLTITAVIVLVFGALLASADEVFADLLGRTVPSLSGATLVRWVFLFPVGTAMVLGAVFLLLAPPAMDPAGTRLRTVRLAEWAIPVGALVVLFASFVAVQLAMLFGGSDYVLRSGGPTYAEHARGGFWQLLTVTVLTLMVIGVVATVAPRNTLVEQWSLRLLLAILALLSLVIVASALFRMHTYQEAYGFTRLRLLVSVVELWLGLVFALVLAAALALRAGWVPRTVVATGIAAILALAVANPDQFIAERNLDRWADGKQLDVAYLAGLSADAAPALVCLPEPERDTVLGRIQRRLDADPDDWRSTNLSRIAARDLLADPACADPIRP